ncbi:BglG family transcription antiterminator [Paenibacillus planticolens]|uniref:PRD domain-containing protein n=1 Tax=Paenibacillus planticolens TaxID=2654976 RepID=A0ABX1ZWA3_9BACL|nr:BglG family transcription antiterminator [Paenibacillus planticolens]NOV04332.1 PRD domain-containing protein [Paenibacillus planticolens]
MRVTHRHRQILELLLSRSDEVTAGEIAAEIKVSTRTVHRELSELEAIVADSGLTLQKKSGKGILLQGDPGTLEAFKRNLLNASAVEYSAQDRKLLILCMLLQEDEPVKLFTLSHELSVTIPTITSDLDELEGWIQKADLILVRRRGYGVGLSGSEANMRKMISRLARNYLDESDLFGNAVQVLTPVTMKLLELIGKEHFSKVEEALWQAEDEGLNALSESNYTNLLIHISIAVSRIQLGRAIELHAEKQSIRQSELLTHVIGYLTKAIEMEFSTAEISYIAELLQPRDVSHPNQLLPQEELSYMEIVWKLIRHMEARSGINYSSDRSLKDGLLSHLESALKQLRTGANIRNPLLAQIKKDYEGLFEDIREAVNETITEAVVPDEEIGYLVMHFGASLERQKQFRRNVRAILVCTSGLGTSKMLAVRLTKELPQIDIVGHASWFEAARIPESEYDLIISTVDLPLDEEQYMKLSPLLTKEEAERLRLFIQNVTLQKDDVVKEQAELSPEAGLRTDRLYRIKQYVNEIVRIIDQFTVHRLEQSFDSLQATLLEMCSYVKLTDVIEDVDRIVELLIKRERQSSQVIPDTGLALFHIRSEFVKVPSLTLFRLSQDLVLDQITPSGVRQVLLMLGPQELSKESLEVLSEISSYLLIPQMIELLKEGSQQEIKQFLSQELEAFLENKK